MVAAIELYFTADAERRVRRLWDALEAEGAPTLREHTHRRHRPHISLVVARELDPERVTAATDDLLTDCREELVLSTVGHFPGGVLWLGSVVTGSLLELHATVHARLADAGVPVDPYYLPGAWVPHCTVSPRMPASWFRTAVPRCVDVLPIQTRVAGVAVADHSRGMFHPFDGVPR